MDPELNRREWLLRCVQAATVLASLSGVVGEAAEWTPQCLTPEQNATLISIGEAIVPGSAAACCNQVIDRILAIESAGNQADLRSALDAFAPFRSATHAGQAEILNGAFTAGNKLEPQFQLIKEWVAATYWSSEAGLKELGWNGRMAWPNYPGCPAHH